MVDEAEWKRRFFLYMGARLFGIVTFFAGIAIAMTDWVRPGGWPAVGAIIALLGALDALFVPRMLKKHWDRDDGNS